MGSEGHFCDMEQELRKANLHALTCGCLIEQCSRSGSWALEVSVSIIMRGRDDGKDNIKGKKERWLYACFILATCMARR